MQVPSTPILHNHVATLQTVAQSERLLGVNITTLRWVDQSKPKLTNIMRQQVQQNLSVGKGLVNLSHHMDSLVVHLYADMMGGAIDRDAHLDIYQVKGYLTMGMEALDHIMKSKRVVKAAYLQWTR
ncbi:hypothetical protein FGO68_gene14529 [Halteria grandinella]|uniref:Uncharacterized protein n=1 Tax=Halteria grandinella TaxID=5974 RepID=A0A8J8STQ5_HALGN|nr:hypothetical protein FGO68_gene14529 [Halteria grandinella]